MSSAVRCSITNKKKGVVWFGMVFLNCFAAFCEIHSSICSHACIYKKHFSLSLSSVCVHLLSLRACSPEGLLDDVSCWLVSGHNATTDWMYRLTPRTKQTKNVFNCCTVALKWHTRALYEWNVRRIWAFGHCVVVVKSTLIKIKVCRGLEKGWNKKSWTRCCWIN